MLTSFLKDTITNLSLLYTPLDSLRVTFTELKMDKKLHPLLAQLLEELATHSAAQVRRYTAILLGVRRERERENFEREMSYLYHISSDYDQTC